MITKKKCLDRYQILSTHSLRKCMEISLENFCMDIGALRLVTTAKVQVPKCANNTFLIRQL